MNNAIDTLGTKLYKLETEWEIVNEELADLDDGIELLQDRIDEVNDNDDGETALSELYDLERSLQYTQDEYDDTESELEHLQDKIDTVENEITKLRNELLTLQQGD